MFSPTQRILFFPAMLLLISSCGTDSNTSKPPFGPSLNVPVQPAQPGDCLSEINITGLVKPATASIAFSRGGRLEKGQAPLRSGMSFNEGQLLCQINNKDAYRELTAIKTDVGDALTNLMPEIKRTLPHKAIDKWRAFIEALKPVALLPAYPSTNLPEEKDIPELKRLESTYKKAAELENGMKDFFYVAPFDGTVSHVFREEDETVKAGETVAEIIGTSAMQLEVSLTKEQWRQVKKGKTYQLTDKRGHPAGTAVFNNSISRKGDAVTCNFTIQPAKGAQVAAGVKLNIRLQEKGSQPCVFVNANQVCHDAVQIVQNGKIETIPVKIISRDGQRLRVTGLTPDQAILVDAYENTPKNIRFVASKK